MVEIFDEINEDIKQEKLEKFWSENGTFIIVSVICVILAVGGKSWWLHHKAEQNAARTTAIITTLNQDDPAKLTALAQDIGGDQQVIASFLAAGLALDNAENDADRSAVALQYADMGQNKDFPKYYRDLAEILSIGISAEVEGQDVAPLLERLKPIAAEGRPYRVSALELMAYLEGDQGNYQGALDHVESILAVDNGVPPALKARAQMLKEYYLLKMSSSSTSEG